MRFLRGLLPVLGTVLLGALPLAAQAPPPPTPLQPGEDIQVTIRGAAERRLPIAVPELYAPSNAAIEAKIAELQAMAEAWRPLRGVAARLLWADYALLKRREGINA